MADIPLQLATLLGKSVVRIRKLDGQPPRVAVIDVISAITGKDARHAAEQLRRLIAQYPDVETDFRAVKLPDARGRKSPQATRLLASEVSFNVSFAKSSALRDLCEIAHMSLLNKTRGAKSAGALQGCPNVEVTILAGIHKCRELR